jgi:hypothetical protein
MILRLSYSMLGLFTLIGGLGCSSERDGDSDSFGTLERSAVLGELDSAGSRALCEASNDLRDESFESAEGARGACLLQIVADVDDSLLLLDVYPERFSTESIIADCEAALERCLDEGPKRHMCTSIGYLPSCKATVGELASCQEGTIGALSAFAESDCETYVQSEAERDRLVDDVRASLSSCSDRLVDCEGELVPPEPEDGLSWFDGGVGEIEPDGGEIDTQSNEEWLAALELEVADLERPECEDALARQEALDEQAAEIAATPIGTQVTLDVEQLTQWKSIRSADLDAVIQRVEVFLDEITGECGWVSYGLAVDGEPGEDRHVVVLLTE